MAWCVGVALKRFLHGCFQRASCRCGAAPNTDGRILSPGEDRLICIVRKRLALHTRRGSLLCWPQDVLWRIQPDLIIELGSSRGGGGGGGGAFFYATVMQFYNPTGKVLSIGPQQIGAANKGCAHCMPANETALWRSGMIRSIRGFPDAADVLKQVEPHRPPRRQVRTAIAQTRCASHR